MRALLAVVMLLGIVSLAQANLWTKTRHKTDGVSCRVPINQLACQIDPSGNVQYVFYGGWGSNAAAAALPSTFVQGPNSPGGQPFWYTNYYCNAWEFQQRCAALQSDGIIPAPTQAQINAVVQTPPVNPAVTFPQNGVIGGVPSLEFVTGMRVCYNKRHKSSPVARIQWDTRVYTARWVPDTTNNPPLAPFPEVIATGQTRTVQCGLTDPTCLFEEEWVAPNGKVIGGFSAKCKWSQGYAKWWFNGQYKPRYWLDKIVKLCATDPMPYPNGRFTVCDNPACTGPTGPNGAGCPDLDTYVCPAAC